MSARRNEVRAVLLAAALVAGCSRGGPTEAVPVQASVEPVGPALPVDHPPIEGGYGDGKTSAEVRRLSVSQLERSFSTVLGADLEGKPITWMIGTTTGFDRYSTTLGEADFLNVTEESLEASALYMKFAADAARDGCNRALATDLARTDPATRAVLRFASPTDTVASQPAAIDENLRYLKLRFHGIKIAADDVERTSALRRLFEAAVSSAAKGTTPTAAHVRVGWHAVCVALLTSPEFHLY